MAETITTPNSAVVPCASCGRLNRVNLDRLADGPRCSNCKTAIALDHPTALNDGNIQRVLRDATVPVIVDFYADWCAPCRMMAPSYEQLASKYTGKALVAKVDTDRSPVISQQLGIRGIPTVIVFKGGNEVARQVGAVPLQRLEQLLQSTL